MIIKKLIDYLYVYDKDAASNSLKKHDLVRQNFPNNLQPNIEWLLSLSAEFDNNYILTALIMFP